MMKRLQILDMLRDDRGNIAMMFGVILFITLGAAGLAIDLTRSSMVRTEIHEAADAGVLAAARYKSGRPDANDETLTAIARKVFDASIKNSDALSIDAFEIISDDSADSLALELDGSMNALLMGVLGQGELDIGARSEVKYGKPPLLEVALALDVTGSMNQQGKISALKNAARDLIETLFDAEDADIKIGIVPFAQYANVGSGYNAASWLNNPGPGFAGCIGSRIYPFNTTDADFDSVKVPGLTGAACPDPITPLSSDEDALITQIDKLDANGWTYIPAGLTPAWQLLTPHEPFTQGVSFTELAAKEGTKAIVLMTDGENTRAPDYPTHDDTSEVLANDLTKEICANIKLNKIVIYTIAYDVSDPDIKDILEKCATSPSHYFDAANSNELSGAFASIANSLRSISLSK